MSTFPLLSFLWVLMGSIVLHEGFINGLEFPLGMGGLLLVGMLCYLKQKSRYVFENFNRLLFVLLSFFVSMAYVSWRMPDRSQVIVRPDREIEVSVVITDLFHTQSEDYFSGIGRVMAAPVHLNYLVNQKMAFGVRSTGILKIGHQGVLKGVLTSILNKRHQPFSDYLKSLQIDYQLQRGRWLLTQAYRPAPDTWMQKANRKLQAILTIHKVPESINNIYKAMLLGEVSFLTPEHKKAFSVSGTLHLFAISGLHIGVIAAFLFYVLSYLRTALVLKVILGLSILGLYVTITGFAPSAQRAWLMIFFLWVGMLLKRESTALNSLIVAFCFSLILRPSVLYHAGFQLSYSVVGGLLLYGLPLSAFWKSHYGLWPDLALKKPIPRMRLFFKKSWNSVLNAFALSIAATLISTPLMIHYFGVLSLMALPLNVILIPLASGVIILGFMSLFLGLLAIPYLPDALNYLACAVLKGIYFLIDKALMLPGSYLHFKWTHYGTGPLCVLLLLIVGLYAPQKIKKTPLFFIFPWVLMGVVFFLQIF